MTSHPIAIGRRLGESGTDWRLFIHHILTETSLGGGTYRTPVPGAAWPAAWPVPWGSHIIHLIAMYQCKSSRRCGAPRRRRLLGSPRPPAPGPQPRIWTIRLCRLKSRGYYSGEGNRLRAQIIALGVPFTLQRRVDSIRTRTRCVKGSTSQNLWRKSGRWGWKSRRDVYVATPRLAPLLAVNIHKVYRKHSPSRRAAKISLQR